MSLSHELPRKNKMKLSDLTTEQLTAIFGNSPSMFRDVYEEWYEHTVEDFVHQLETIGFSGVQVRFSGFWSQGDGACFHGKYYKAEIALDEYASEELKTLYQSIQDSKVEYAALFHSRNYSHENSVRYDFECEEEYCEDTFINACKEFMRHIYSTLEKEYDYLTSVEYFLEKVGNGQYDDLHIVQTPEGSIKLIQTKETKLL
jgi:hypothetical protein